jgi:hypothetical protein
MKPQRQEENGMITAELKYLRAQVASLKKERGEPVAAAGETRAPVKPEVRVDLKAIAKQRDALLKLVVAVENYFGPEKGVEKPKMGDELREALNDGAALVKREKKP